MNNAIKLALGTMASAAILGQIKHVDGQYMTQLTKNIGFSGFKSAYLLTIAAGTELAKYCFTNINSANGWILLPLGASTALATGLLATPISGVNLLDASICATSFVGVQLIAHNRSYQKSEQYRLYDTYAKRNNRNSYSHDRRSMIFTLGLAGCTAFTSYNLYRGHNPALLNPVLGDEFASSHLGTITNATKCILLPVASGLLSVFCLNFQPSSRTR